MLIKLKRKSTCSLPDPSTAREKLKKVSPPPKPFFENFSYKFPVTCDLSVIVPVYNTERYLVECLGSIVGQKVDFDMEVVVVNDGSSDGSLNVIKNFAAKDARIRVIDQANRGFSGARNVAIDAIRGVLCFVDSDDVLAPGHLQTLWDELQRSDADWISACYSKMSEDGRDLGPTERVRTHGGPWARMYRRHMWAHVRFPEGFWFEDTLMAYCIKPLFKEAFANDRGYFHRVHAGSITSTASLSPKGFDSYWVVEEMLDWCDKLGIPFADVYRQTILQFGPLLVSRVESLDEESMKCLFALCCECIGRYYPNMENATIGGGLGLLEESLLSGNYDMWREACRWVR